MYYKKYPLIPSLPEDLKQDLVELAIYNVENNIPMAIWYRRYETTNYKSIAFLEHHKRLEETGGKESGGVGFYDIPYNLLCKILEFYQQVNHPEINFTKYWLQVVTGSNFVGPHMDDPLERTDGFLYILKAGGEKVTTTWYEVKQEYQHLQSENYSVIPYSRLDRVESHCLEEDMWHWLNFAKIHGVTNQESLRIAIWGTYN
jgi:hypothetical protein